jgi:ABC-type lipoprotein release transport system permease subunit
MQRQNHPILSQGMHKYVLIMLGVFTLIVATFPLSMFRVSQKEKFLGSHVKSLTPEYQPEKTAEKSQDTQPVVAAKTSTDKVADKNIQQQSIEATQPQIANTVETKVIQPQAEIADNILISALNQKLQDQIATVWQNKPLDERLEYRVSVNANGNVVAFEPRSQTAADLAAQTPLPLLVKYHTSNLNSSQLVSISQERLGKFRVIFTSQGSVQVSPWHGWNQD